MQIKELTVGLDWGTHSSKWWYTTSRGGAFRQPSAFPASLIQPYTEKATPWWFTGNTLPSKPTFEIFD